MFTLPASREIRLATAVDSSPPCETKERPIMSESLMVWRTFLPGEFNRRIASELMRNVPSGVAPV